MTYQATDLHGNEVTVIVSAGRVTDKYPKGDDVRYVIESAGTNAPVNNSHPPVNIRCPHCNSGQFRRMKRTPMMRCRTCGAMVPASVSG